MQNKSSATLRIVALYFVFWTAMGLFLFSESLTQTALGGLPISRWSLLAIWLSGMYLVSLCVPVVWRLGATFPFERRYWVRRLAFHLPASAVWASAELALASLVLTHLKLLPSMVPSTFAGAFVYLMISDFHSNVLLYWEVLAVQAAYRYYLRYRQRERESLVRTAELKTELARAQLNALKMQLQPHFLFNTLNGIMVLVRQNKMGEAEEMLARFSDLLRSVLDEGEAQEAPLSRELECLKLYLAIEQVRFQDRLRATISAEPSVLDAAVPHMCLQPIVENAVRHGIGKRAAAGKIVVIARRWGALVEIKVEDDGPGFPPTADSESWGVGLSNTRARLRQLYGDAGRLETANREEGGAAVTITVPYHPPARIEKAEERVQFLTGEMVASIAGHDFEKARSYSNEDLQARRDLEHLREKNNS